MAAPLLEGILLVDKPKGKTSFSLIRVLRKLLNVKKIGHAGTLDPLATGVMVLMIGKNYTRLSDKLLSKDKEYEAQITLGVATDTYDAEGKIEKISDHIPALEAILEILKKFQGEFLQVPPMFSAKKVDGKKLYDLAREGKEIARQPVAVRANTVLIEYHYPKIHLRIQCSKGTYIRCIAHELGEMAGCGAHLSELKRTKSGPYTLEDCIEGAILFDPPQDATRQIIGNALIKALAS